MSFGRQGWQGAEAQEARGARSEALRVTVDLGKEAGGTCAQFGRLRHGREAVVRTSCANPSIRTDVGRLVPLSKTIDEESRFRLGMKVRGRDCRPRGLSEFNPVPSPAALNYGQARRIRST